MFGRILFCWSKLPKLLHSPATAPKTWWKSSCAVDGRLCNASSSQGFFTPRQRRQKLDRQILNTLTRLVQKHFPSNGAKNMIGLFPLQVYRSPCRKWQVYLRGRSLKEWLWNPEILNQTETNKSQQENNKKKILEIKSIS